MPCNVYVLETAVLSVNTTNNKNVSENHQRFATVGWWTGCIAAFLPSWVDWPVPAIPQNVLFCTKRDSEAVWPHRPLLSLSLPHSVFVASVRFQPLNHTVKVEPQQMRQRRPFLLFFLPLPLSRSNVVRLLWRQFAAAGLCRTRRAF